MRQSCSAGMGWSRRHEFDSGHRLCRDCLSGDEGLQLRFNQCGRRLPGESRQRRIDIARSCIAILPPLMFKMSEGQDRAPVQLTIAWTVTAQGRMALVEPQIVAYHGNHKGRKDGSRRVKTV